MTAPYKVAGIDHKAQDVHLLEQVLRRTESLRAGIRELMKVAHGLEDGGEAHGALDTAYGRMVDVVADLEHDIRKINEPQDQQDRREQDRSDMRDLGEARGSR